MAQVFLSYSSRHRDLTRDLAARLAAEGYSVWWDRELEAWGEYEPQINEALLAADVVVVIWSPGAVASRFVKAEVERALLSRKLVNLRAPDFPLNDVPLNYAAVDHIQTLDLDDLAPVLKAIDTVRHGETLVGARQLHEHYHERFGQSLFDSRRQALPKDPAMVTPSVLLQAPFEVATYADAAGVLADMLEWCHGEGIYSDTNREVAGRLLHGPGGLGKTRLMIEAVRRLRADGWLAGFYPAPPTGDPARTDMRRLAIQQVLSNGPELGVLMVLDYAESRAADVIELARMARKRPDEAMRPFRLVLLSRGEGWWQDIYRTEPEVQVVFNKRGAPHGDVIAAPPLPEGPDRLKVFDAMRATLAPIVAQQATAGRFPPVKDADLPQDRRDRLASSPAYARPLALQMEALLSLAGEGGGEIAELLESVLLLERNHWRKVIVGLAGDERREMAMRRGISQVTALGGVEAKQALQRLMQRDPHFGQRAPIDMPLTELNRLYGRGQAWVAALEPDLIGEHELLASGDEELLDACRAWIDGLPEPDRSPRRRILFTALQRAARAEHGSRARQAEVLLRHLVAGLTEDEVPDLIAVAIETPGPLPALLTAAVPRMIDQLFATLSNVMPAKTVVLSELADSVATRRVDAARSSVIDEDVSEEGRAKLARALHSRGNTLANLGRREEAREATEEAVAITRRLASTRPETFEQHLAACLSDLGIRLSDLGRLEEALAAQEEGALILKRLAAARPDAFEPHLASSLSNLGTRLSDLADLEEALAVEREAVTIRRRLVTVQRETFEPHLAASLHNLGIRLSDLGRHDEALAAEEEAVAIFRRLAEVRPDAFEPDFAKSLISFGRSLSDLGRYEAAVSATERAVEIFQRLATVRPDSFEPSLSGSLSNLGIDLSKLGRPEEALTATQKAVTIRRRLASARPEVFASDLARSLTNLGNRLSSLDRREEALNVTLEAVKIRRGLVSLQPEVFEPELAMSLGALSNQLRSFGRRLEAIAAAKEGMAMLKPHYSRYPATHQSLWRALHAASVLARAAAKPDDPTT